jgi:hypothetical protein
VVLYELLSLDGVAEDPDKFVIDWDEAMDANLAAVIATQDAVILGRRSYLGRPNAARSGRHRRSTARRRTGDRRPWATALGRTAAASPRIAP